MKYELTGKDGSRGGITAPCFGGLNSAYGSSSSSSIPSKKIVPSETWVDPRMDISKLSYITFEPRYDINGSWSIGNKNSSEDKLNHYISEAVEIGKRLNNFKDCLRVNPFTKKVDVFVDIASREKIMATLFIFRNLSNHRTNCETYKEARSEGYNPLFSLLVSEMIYSCPKPFGRSDTHFIEMGESTLINLRTFGKRSFLSFLRQDGFDFYGRKWKDKPGYSRESDYRSDNILFNGVGRYLADTLSIEWDDPLPFQIKNAGDELTKEDLEPHLGGDMGFSIINSHRSYLSTFNFDNKSSKELFSILEQVANDNSIDVRS